MREKPLSVSEVEEQRRLQVFRRWLADTSPDDVRETLKGLTDDEAYGASYVIVEKFKLLDEWRRQVSELELP